MLWQNTVELKPLITIYFYYSKQQCIKSGTHTDMAEFDIPQNSFDFLIFRLTRCIYQHTSINVKIVNSVTAAFEKTKSVSLKYFEWLNALLPNDSSRTCGCLSHLVAPLCEESSFWLWNPTELYNIVIFLSFQAWYWSSLFCWCWWPQALDSSFIYSLSNATQHSNLILVLAWVCIKQILR